MLNKGIPVLILILFLFFATKTCGQSQTVLPSALTPRLQVQPRASSDLLIDLGEEQDLLSLILINQGQGPFHSIKLTSLSIGVKDHSIGEIFASYSIQIPTRGISIKYSAIFTDKFEVVIPEGIILGPGTKDSLVLSATARDDTKIECFVLTLKASDFQAFDYLLGNTGDPVPVVSENGSSLSYQSEPFCIPGNLHSPAVSLFPNPFHPGNGPVTIIYSPSSPSEVSLEIFTLAGEKVWEVTNPPNQNSFNWDGRNSDGKAVLSGVYLGRMRERATGKETKLRIGVVR